MRAKAEMKTRKRTSFKKDARRKHHHWQLTVFYNDGERFARTYTVRARAAGFAEAFTPPDKGQLKKSLVA
jgi:hypothetical protein